MASSYYQKCPELDVCNELIEKYYNKGQFKECFEGHLKLAEEKCYALAECQVGYFYLEGLGCAKDAEKAFYWTTRSAEHGNRDGQFNLAWMYENGICTSQNLEKAKVWYKAAALQDHNLAIEKCHAYGL